MSALIGTDRQISWDMTENITCGKMSKLTLFKRRMSTQDVSFQDTVSLRTVILSVTLTLIHNCAILTFNGKEEYMYVIVAL